MTNEERPRNNFIRGVLSFVGAGAKAGVVVCPIEWGNKKSFIEIVHVLGR
jgi:hypothetical protein